MIKKKKRKLKPSGKKSVNMNIKKIVRCSCGQKNMIDFDKAVRQIPICGICKAELPLG